MTDEEEKKTTSAEKEEKKAAAAKEEAGDGGEDKKKKDDLVLRHSWTFWLRCADGEEKDKTHELGTVSTARQFWTVYNPLSMFFKPMHTESETPLLKVKAPMKSDIFMMRGGQQPAWNGSFYSFRVLRGRREFENAEKAVTTTLLSVVSGDDVYEIVEGVNIRVRPTLVGIDIWFGDAKASKTKPLRSSLIAMISAHGIACDKELTRYSQHLTGPAKKAAMQAKKASKAEEAPAASAATSTASEAPQKSKKLKKPAGKEAHGS